VTATIFMVRHAAHDDVGKYLAGRAPAVNLGPNGLAQAERLGARMQRENFEVIIASPRERTQQTAAAIAAAHTDIAIETVEALDEVDFGHWSGSTFDALNKQDAWLKWNSMRSMAATPTGETMLDVQRRALGVLRRFAFREGDMRLVAVTHGDVIKAFVSYVLGLPVDAWPRFEISPASITTIVVGDWGGKVVTLNETID
jgi:broad specificity phosphatase PhoE